MPLCSSSSNNNSNSNSNDDRRDHAGENERGEKYGPSLFHGPFDAEKRPPHHPRPQLPVWRARLHAGDARRGRRYARGPHRLSRPAPLAVHRRRRSGDSEGLRRTRRQKSADEDAARRTPARLYR